MRRARQTAAGIKKSRYVEWRALREIEVGVCDGMTYAQVKIKKNKKRKQTHEQRFYGSGRYHSDTQGSHKKITQQKCNCHGIIFVS